MKRKVAVVLAVLVPVGVIIAGVGIILMRRSGLPEGAQGALSVYLRYRYPGPSASIASASQATQPWLLKPEQSSATYSDSPHYHTTVNVRAIATKEIRLTPSPASRDVYRGSDALAALPYPPEDLWCVRLNAGQEGPEVVLVALHMGLYNADWVVHELPANWPAAELSAVLADVGCGVE